MWDRETKEWSVLSHPISPSITHSSLPPFHPFTNLRLPTNVQQRPRRLRNVGSILPVEQTRSERPIKGPVSRRVTNRTTEMGTRPQASGEELVGRVWDCDSLMSLLFIFLLTSPAADNIASYCDLQWPERRIHLRRMEENGESLC
jgi:hypothetical protein